MTTVRIGPASVSNNIPIYEFYNAISFDNVLERTATTFQVGNGFGSLAFEGTGFRYRGRMDVTDVTAGRLGTIIAETLNGNVVTFTNINRSAESFFDYVYDNFSPFTTQGQRPMALLMSGNDRLIGGANEDTLAGYRGNDRLFGGLDEDNLRGDRGNDRLAGGLGFDTLTGGRGDDVFVFNTAASGIDNFDTITDFNRRDDIIHIDNAAFVGLGRAGRLGARFEVAEDATKAGTRIFHDRIGLDAGIYFDPDGNGPAGAALIAQVTFGLRLSAADFLVI